MMNELTALWNSLQDAEYLHLVLEPLPLFGLAFGLVLFGLSFVVRERKTRLLALALIVGCCASVRPYLNLREKCQPRILAMQPAAYHPLIQEQSARRAGSSWFYYGIAAWCAAALVMMRKNTGLLVSLTTIVVCLAGFLHALWLHKKECEVFHRNIVKFAPVR